MSLQHYSNEVMQIIQESNVASLNDIDVAVDAALARVKQLPNYQVLTERLIRDAVKDLVHDARHQVNKGIKQRRGEYTQPINAPVKMTQTVQEVYQSYYNYCIGSRTLGSLTGAELLEVADQQEKQAKGFVFNSTLCRKLATVVPPDRTVKEVVSKQKDLAKYFSDTHKEVYEAE